VAALWLLAGCSKGPGPATSATTPATAPGTAAEQQDLAQAQQDIADLEKSLAQVDAGLNANQQTEGDVVVVPADLTAAQSGPIDTARKDCDAAVAKRLTSLGTVKKNLDATPAVAGPNRAALDSQIDAAVTGLTALKTTMDADSALPKLRTDCRKVVGDYYVYALLVPRVELVRAGGRVQAAAVTLKHLAGLLQTRVDAAKAANKDIASAQGYVTDLGLKVDAATKAVAGVPTAVLPLDAAGFPANRPVLAGARVSLESARGALKGALAAAGSAIGAINALG
jgi:uncharacterized phage infection (PIP) family protein YhgE